MFRQQPVKDHTGKTVHFSTVSCLGLRLSCLSTSLGRKVKKNFAELMRVESCSGVQRQIITHEFTQRGDNCDSFRFRWNACGYGLRARVRLGHCPRKRRDSHSKMENTSSDSGDSVWDVLAAARKRARGVGLLSGGYSRAELNEAGAFRIYAGPLDMLQHTGDLGIEGLRP